MQTYLLFTKKKWHCDDYLFLKYNLDWSFALDFHMKDFEVPELRNNLNLLE